MTTGALVLSCSGGGGESATAGESDSTTTTTATATETTQGGSMTESGTTQGGTASMSDSDATTASSASESDGTTTGALTDSATAATDSTSAGPGTATDTDPTTGTDSDSDTNGPNFCGQDPPLGFIGDFNAECKNDPKIGTFTPVLEWNKSAWSIAPSSTQIMMQPVVGPLTDDDKDGVYGSAGDMPAIVVVSFVGTAWTGAGVLRAVTGEGTELFTVSDQSLGGASGLAIGNIDDDPAPEIIAVTTNAAVKAFEHNGALKWTSATYAGDFGSFPAGAAPSIADMDGDGKPEIIVGRVILNNNGTFRAKGAFGVGQGAYSAASFAADVDGDGTLEVVVGNALYRPNGTAIWNLNLADGFPAVADFTGDGKAEIVVVTSGGVRLQSAEGAVLWTKVNPAGVGGPPTIADFDGDGEPEIGIAGKTAYIVFDTNGDVLWQKPTKDDSSSATGSAVYDFEGDGVADIVYADETSLWVFSGIDGAVKLKAPHNSGTLIETPVIVDVDNDGEVEIVVTHNNAFFGGPLLGISVIGDQNKSWRPGRKIWNQHAYSITNVEDTAKIPEKAKPNWPTYNNFRSGDLSGNNGSSAPDLKVIAPDTCVNECGDDDQATIWVQVGNAGAVALTAGATLAVYVVKDGVESLDQEIAFPDELAPGEFSGGVPIKVKTTDLESIRIVAKPKESECITDPADEILLTPPFCAIPG